jgi:predicted methyltransferase
LPCILAAVSCAEIKQRIYEPSDRDAWQHPERVIESLSIAPGQRVADLGAGAGYFTFRLAQAVGPAGVVYALDVDEDMTRLLERRRAHSSLGRSPSLRSTCR